MTNKLTSPRGLLLTVDLNALKDNYAALAAKAKGAKTAVSIKANAYGLGADRCGTALYEAGCRDFFVARMGEALALKPHVRDAKIYIFDGITSPEDLDLCHEHGLTPTLNNHEQITVFKEKPCPAILHIDTGMNRLGLHHSQVERVSPTTREYIEMVMTHAACADDDNDEMTEEQFARFEKAAAQFPNAKRSVCNSAATQKYPHMHSDLVRCGIAVYGAYGMKPVAHLTAPILSIHKGRKGETVGYGATYTFEQDATIATLGIGYADGLLRSGSNTAHFYINGTPCPITGRISMDLTTTDISALGDSPKVGDSVEILGEHQNIDALAKDLSSIPYEVLTAFGNAMPKNYI